jgi:hypothetical protein
MDTMQYIYLPTTSYRIRDVCTTYLPKISSKNRCMQTQIIGPNKQRQCRHLSNSRLPHVVDSQALPQLHAIRIGNSDWGSVGGSSTRQSYSTRHRALRRSIPDELFPLNRLRRFKGNIARERGGWTLRVAGSHGARKYGIPEGAHAASW